jgi:hypothetical protein
MYNPTRCTCFAIVSRNHKWPRIISFPQVKEKQRWFLSLKSIEKLMQISFLNSKHVHIPQCQQVFQLVVKI